MEKGFEQMVCWKKARELNKEIYILTSKSRFSKDFALREQIRRASISSNIAEGFGRFSNKEFVRFLNIASSSLDEVHSMILLYSELDFISNSQKEQTIELLKQCKYQILGFIKYLNTKL